ASLPSGGALSTWLDTYCYQYRYDQRNRLIEKQLPGQGRICFVYNTLDQIVATQDANQRNRSPQEWTITKFDGLGRIVLKGKWTRSGTPGSNYRAAVQNEVNGISPSNLWEE